MTSYFSATCIQVLFYHSDFALVTCITKIKPTAYNYYHNFFSRISHHILWAKVKVIIIKKTVLTNTERVNTVWYQWEVIFSISTRDIEHTISDPIHTRFMSIFLWLLTSVFCSREHLTFIEELLLEESGLTRLWGLCLLLKAVYLLWW